jgi:nicotinate phosphoribosyltransferase
MPHNRHAIDPRSSPLLTDLYQLNMIQAYLDGGMTDTAVFEFFFRKFPPSRGFLVAAGLAQLVEFLEELRFGESELKWLTDSGRFGSEMIEGLAAMRFTGDLDAMPEGTLFFPDEPIVRITAPLPEAQLIETRLINLVHFQTLIASKAARMVLAAPGKTLVDFGLRRAHGSEAGLLAARASYLAGFAGSATIPAAPLFGVPIFGTMAHSFIQAHDSEEAAFLAFARARPDNLVLLIDTYDTRRAALKVVALAPRLAAEGIKIHGVRLDSGDLAAEARLVRPILDDGGLRSVEIFASGGLDEVSIRRILAAGAPIDGFGIGTSLTTSSDVAALDCAYKLQEYAGKPKRKLSAGKATWPGRKQISRSFDGDGVMAGDQLTLASETRQGLLEPVMRNGERIAAPPSLVETRAYASAQLRRLPAPMKDLEPGADYPVRVSHALRALAENVDRDIARANLSHILPISKLSQE